jgi:uncharacterized protein YciI
LRQKPKKPYTTRTNKLGKQGGEKMPKFLIRWQINTKYCPPTPEERENLELATLEEDYASLKAARAAGIMMDTGRFVDRSGGYTVTEAPSEEAVFVELQKARQKWGLQVNFDVKQVLTVEEALEAARQVVEKRKAAALLKK